MSKIFLTGDTHATNDIDKLIDFADNNGKELTKDDKLIILGDFGFIWNWRGLDEKEKYWLDWFKKQPWTTLFLDGNHENFNRLEKYPIVDYCGAKAAKVNNSLFHLLRGQIYTFNDQKYMTIGGADSIDQEFRTENKLWWKQETIGDKDIELAISNAEIYNNEVDYVLTHAAPNVFVDELWLNHVLEYEVRYFSSSEARLDKIREQIKFKKWFFGHYHCDYSSSKFEVLYNNIKELS